MDRDAKASATATTTDTLAPRPNGRAAPSGLVVNRDGRKPLFGAKSGRDAGATAEKDTRGGPSGGSKAPVVGRATAASSSRPATADAQGPPLPVRISSAAKPSPSPDTRIPAPRSGAGRARPRRPVTLTDAYKMAEEEDIRRQGEPVGGDVSPSPAPRPWLSRHESDTEGMRRMLDRSPVESKGRRGHMSRRSTDSMHSSVDSLDSLQMKSSLEDLERKVQQMSENSDRRGSKDSSGGAEPTRPPSGRQGILGPARSLFGKARIGPKIAETGDLLARKTSKSSLDDKTQEEGRRGSSNSIRPKSSFDRFIAMAMQEDAEGLLPGQHPPLPDQDVPIPSIEGGPTPQEPTPPSSRPTSANPDFVSPNKSHAWQADMDFTAGDLQVSQSPRIRVNNKLEGIRRLELESGLEFGLNGPVGIESPDTEELDDTEELLASGGSHGSQKAPKLDDSRRASRGGSPAEDHKKFRPGRQNTKLDEIRERETEAQSKRAIASSSLDKIRELNSSFDARRERSREHTPGFDPETHKPLPRPGLEGEGEQIPNTPVTIFKSAISGKDGRGSSGSGNSRSSSGSRGPGHMRDESRELLRSLARVTSASPALEAGRKPGVTSVKSEATEDTSKKSTTHSTTSSRQSSTDALRPPPPPRPESRTSDTLKPTVGFAGLRRVRSTDSDKDKRSSMALSDNDPTDRIEQEMKLFAPLENHSERGSIRAPSPDPESDSDEAVNLVDETPRAVKRDPLTMPTPKVVGAYIETPAAPKTKDVEVEEFSEGAAASTSEGESRPSDAKPSRAASHPRERKLAIAAAAPTLKKESTSSESDSHLRSRKPRESSSAITAGTMRRRRARSLPKRQRPLINTAKPPTVRDDLLAISRAHNIEDSTLDDFGEMLAATTHHGSSRFEVEDLSDTAKTEQAAAPAAEPVAEDGKKGARKEDRATLEDFERVDDKIVRSLKNMRTSKRGIERLEAQVGQSNQASIKPETAARHRVDRSTHATPTSQGVIAYVELPLPVPRLYQRTPTFRFTLFGILFLFFSAWYAAESAMCGLYCRPTTCPAGSPCVWSPDDPAWGFAMPIKLDEWLAGGAGRQLATLLLEEVSDHAADAWDALLGKDLREVNVAALSFEERRRHRRRMRKKGLLKTRNDAAAPEHKVKWDAWRQTRLAKERAGMGYAADDVDESFGGDERL